MCTQNIDVKACLNKEMKKYVYICTIDEHICRDTCVYTYIYIDVYVCV